MATGAAGILIGGCAATGPVTEHWTRTYDPRRYGKDEQSIARHFNLHRGRWWNYYSRGRWHLEYGHDKQAEEDFRRALRLRRADKRSARSYGMHFWDYFARRELGIALLRQGKYAESARQLEASMASEASAKAAFYLNKARAEKLRQSRVDRAPPTIKIDAQAGKILTNRLTAAIRAEVTDDQFVGAVSVGGRDLYVELARRRIDVLEQVRLKPGRNVVSIEATDLAGRTASEQVEVTVDVRPPVVCITRAAAKPGDRDTVEVDLAALDDLGLREIRVGAARIACDGARRKAVQRLEAKVGPDGLHLSAVDLAGNVTSAVVDVLAVASAPRARRPGGGEAVYVAAGPLGPPGPPGPSADLTGPRLLRLPKVTLTVADEKFYLDGEAEDPEGIRSIVVNGESLLIEPGTRKAVFSPWIPLKPGRNDITVVATDRAGNTTRWVVRVRRIEPVMFAAAARYTIGLSPLVERGPIKGSGFSLHEDIQSALIEDRPERFNVVERDMEALERIVTELKIAALSEKDKAIGLGKELHAEAMLFGSVEEGSRKGRTYMNVMLRLVDVGTRRILCAVDAYHEDKDRMAVRKRCAKALVSKLKRKFPLIKATVVGRKGDVIEVDRGMEHALRQGMRLLLYRKRIRAGRPAMPEAIEYKGRQVEAVIRELAAKQCTAKLTDARAAEAVKSGDMVITK